MPKPRVTEPTFYPALIDVICEAGGTGIQEVSYDSIPDIVFELGDRRWLLSVKIGQDARTIKSAFVQYLRHKDDSGIQFGMLVLLPEFVRTIDVTEEAVKATVQNTRVTALVDAGAVKDEVRDRPFPGVITFLTTEVLARLQRRERTYYSLPLVISLLQQQVSEMMEDIALDETDVLRIVTDPELLMGLGHLERGQAEAVARFLASYILMSQILFLRLLFAERPTLFTDPVVPASHHSLRRAFARILDINYRPIYEVNVLDAIPDTFLRDTFDLIWGLEIERVRYELPGRIFHELMPSEIRKMLAAFYTRPQAADILADLAIDQSGQIVFDPACGSGTILVSSYRRKEGLFHQEGLAGSPHRRFCEEEIFGADIMPFALHLTSANLAALDVTTTIQRTQMIQGDSLELGPGMVYQEGIQLDMFPVAPTARTTSGELYEVSLPEVDIILMNPPFTKVERRIQDFVDMQRFRDRCGGEVGLWGHFVVLADNLLKDDGMFGAVIPINVLRGRESERVRRILFDEWTPLYILKATRNYGFSEWAEYRDILFVARKQRPRSDHQVRFCLVKKDLTRLTEDEPHLVACAVREHGRLRSDDLDIDSHALSEIQTRFTNLMWFCGVTDLRHRDTLVSFANKFSGSLQAFPDGYFREGYRPVPKGVSKFLFLTRHSNDSRVQQAFLRFSNEDPSFIRAESPLGAHYEIERTALTPTLRTPIGLSTMDITARWDYIAHEPYAELNRVCRAVGFQPRRDFNWDDFWTNLQSDLERTTTHLVGANRINPFSPSTNLAAFLSEDPISPSNQMNVILEPDLQRARAVCVLLNSALFLAQFFLLKEESTGRYIHIRFYDLYEMNLFPTTDVIDPLASVFEERRGVQFPALRNQLDDRFDERYQEFWARERGRDVQERLWRALDQPVQPSRERLNFDLAVCQALGVPMSADELVQLYEVLVKEMIIIRGLSRD